MDRSLKVSLISLVCNTGYSVCHIVLGIAAHSWWFLTIGVYYAVLSIARFVVHRYKGRKRTLIRFAGIMLMVLSVPLAGTVILSFIRDRGRIFHLIVMLAIAVYAFTKITLAAIKWIKARKSTSAKMITLRNISFADAFASIFSLQRSMLVSFDGMSETEIRMMNAATGSAVCIIIFLLGLNLIRKEKDHSLPMQ